MGDQCVHLLNHEDIPLTVHSGPCSGEEWSCVRCLRPRIAIPSRQLLLDVLQEPRTLLGSPLPSLLAPLAWCHGHVVLLLRRRCLDHGTYHEECVFLLD